ncbi:unnamed protein product [Citrullus colocynthis]|uniref:Uncharacterized protein n=1 Tax=Citrullus colocynthis TaxID=252529 RepID=A0ABP0Z9F7_9ROSI
MCLTGKGQVADSKADDGKAEVPDCSYKLRNHKRRYLARVKSLTVKMMMAKLKCLTAPKSYTATKEVADDKVDDVEEPLLQVTQLQREVFRRSQVADDEDDDCKAEVPNHSYRLHNHKRMYLAGVRSLTAKLMMAKLKCPTAPIGYTATKEGI